MRTAKQNNIILIRGESETIEIHAGGPEGRRATCPSRYAVCVPKSVAKRAGGLQKVLEGSYT